MYPQFIDNERKTLVDTLRDIAKDYDVLRIATGYWDLAGTLKIINEIKDGSIKQNAFMHDRKIGKPNTLYLKPVQTELLLYRQWLLDHKLDSEWLFPSIQHPERHITEKQFYKIMSKVGDLLGINYLGTHTMRKTGAYRVYTQSNYNIGLVMHLLNHSSEAMTLAYLGLDQASTESMLDQIDFG